MNTTTEKKEDAINGLLQTEEEFKELRKGRLGCSSIGDIMGVGYNSRIFRAKVIMGLETDEPKTVFAREIFSYGRRNEINGIRAYMNAFNAGEGMYYDNLGSALFPNLPLVGTPDCLDTINKCVVEIKCPIYGFPEDLRLGHYLQILSYLQLPWLQDMEFGRVVYWRPEGIHVYKVENDRNLWKIIKANIESFFKKIKKLKKHGLPTEREIRANFVWPSGQKQEMMEIIKASAKQHFKFEAVFLINI